MNTRIYFLAAAIIFCAVYPAVSQASQAGDIENQGLVLILQGKAEEGLVLMERAVDLEPKNAARHMNYASILMTKGRSQLEEGRTAEANATLKEAEEHLLLAARLFKNTPPERLSKSQCYALLGDIYLYAFGQTQKAITAYRQALEEDPANASVKDILRGLEGAG